MSSNSSWFTTLCDLKNLFSFNSTLLSLPFIMISPSVTTDDLGPDSEALRQLLAGYPPLIENVMQQDNNLGYVEVRLDLSIFFDEIKYLHQKNILEVLRDKTKLDPEVRNFLSLS